jgi:hypothetical protein
MQQYPKDILDKLETTTKDVKRYGQRPITSKRLILNSGNSSNDLDSKLFSMVKPRGQQSAQKRSHQNFEG